MTRPRQPLHLLRLKSRKIVHASWMHPRRWVQCEEAHGTFSVTPSCRNYSISGCVLYGCPVPHKLPEWPGSIVGFVRRVAVIVEAVRKILVRWSRPAHDIRDDGATVTMDTGKVDLVLQYALAVASEADEPFDRRLGKIH